MKNRKTLAAGLAASAIAATSFLGVASAQTTSTAPSSTAPSATANDRAAARSARQADRAKQEDAFLADLASRLGVTKEKIVAAQQSVMASATRPTFDPNKTEAQFKAERAAAQKARLSAFASALGVSTDALTKALVDSAKARIDADVSAGTLTAAQGAARKAMIDADLAAGETPGLGGFGGHGRGGFGGGFGGRGGRR